MLIRIRPTVCEKPRAVEQYWKPKIRTITHPVQYHTFSKLQIQSEKFYFDHNFGWDQYFDLEFFFAYLVKTWDIKINEI